MAKFMDFGSVYGKLGAHPGTLTGDQAVALFAQGMKCPQGSSITEYWPNGGRSTVILAAVCRNLGGKLFVVTNWSANPPGAEMWFQRAVKLHKLDQIVTIDTELPSAPALTVIRAGVNAPVDGKVLVLGDLASSNGYVPVERGLGWALYTHMAPKIESVSEAEIIQNCG